MKITGPRSTPTVAPARKTRRASAAGFAAEAPETTGGGASPAAGAAAPLAGAAGVGSVDAVLALQEAGDATDAPARAMTRAGDLLDALDGLKLALLEGRSVGGSLSRLTGVVRRARETVNDPKLESILNEVEVRAAVEIAKHAAA